METKLTWTKQQLSQTLGNEPVPLEMVLEQFLNAESWWSVILGTMMPIDKIG